MAADRAIFGGAGWEMSNKWDNEKPKERKKREESAGLPQDLQRSRRRAAAKIRDICLCNPFRWFVTLTLSAEKINRYSIDEALRRMRSWLDNRVRRKGLVYVLVPERHKDGAIHFHGFFNDVDIGIVDSGTMRLQGVKAPKKPRSAAQRQEWLSSGAHIVYNIADWELGFSTAIEVYGDYDAAIAYSCKYIEKQAEKIGGRWYYSGGDIKKPVVQLVQCDLREIEAAGGYSFTIEEAGLALCILRGKVDQDTPHAEAEA